MKKQMMLFALAVCLAGCAKSPPPTVTNITPWADGHAGGRVFTTASYAIHTTVTDDEAVRRMAEVLEGSRATYVTLTGVSPPADRPLPVFYFATYDQWADYTRRETGPMADVYLRVFNGGYTLGDRVVCWNGSTTDVLMTVAHEGLHAFVARHFARRLPPVIEEGLAAACEDVGPAGPRLGDHPVPRRQAALRAAVSGDYLIPLDTLLLLHAGDLSDRPPALREGFYAQCWALAAFLRDSPRYRDGFRRMLTDTAAGIAPVDLGPNREDATYNAGLVRPLLQHYVAPNWAAFTKDFAEWTRHAAERSAGERPDAS